MATFSTLREFQQNSNAVLRQAREHGGMAYLTSRGKPVAILMPVSAENADAIADECRRQRFAAAFRSAQASISRSDAEKFTPERIDKLIARTRKSRRK